MIDRRISLALAFAIAVETAGALLWSGRAAARLDAVESRVDDQRATAERLARIETELADMRSQLARIEQTLDARRRP